jgi:hypothetical protein
VAINGEMDPSTPLARSPAITDSEKKWALDIETHRSVCRNI